MRTWPALAVSGLTETDLFQAALTDFDVAAIDDASADAWHVFFHTAAERARARQALQPAFPELTMTDAEIDDGDWAARSQASLTAVRVGGIVVAPPWDVAAAQALPAPSAEAASSSDHPLVVVIQPSMGFGTGHHATTRLCLAAMQTVELRGRPVIDVGTGSGVLAIAASLRGAAPVVAIDTDPDAIQSAQENLALNPAAVVDLRVGDLRTTAPGVADLVIANLTGGLLIQAAAQLERLVAPAGHLVVSGLMRQEEADVVAALAAFRVREREQEDEWVCLTLQRPGTFL